MKCRYCERVLEKEGIVCPACGYDPKTDTISSSFKPSAKLRKKESQSSRLRADSAGSPRTVFNPRIKKFAFFGLGLVVFSVFYKYNFNLNAVAFEASAFLNKFKKNGFNIVGVFDRAKESAAEKAKEEMISNNFIVQGIFFDPYGGSLVVVNGKNFSEGDVFKGISISKIKRDSVEIVKGGESRVLKVKQSVPFIE